MAKRKKSMKQRSPKLLKRDRCMKTEIPAQRKKLIKKPQNKKLSPRKFHQKAFIEAAKVCNSK